MTNVAASRTVPVMTGRSESTTESIDERADPVQVEDPLGDDRAAEQAGQVDAGRGHDRRQAGAQRVLADDDALTQALGARGADVVLAQGLEHLVAGEPGVERRGEQGQRDPGQDAAPGTTATGCRRTGHSPSYPTRPHLIWTKKISSRPMKNDGNE